MSHTNKQEIFSSEKDKKMATKTYRTGGARRSIVHQKIKKRKHVFKLQLKRVSPRDHLPDL